MKQRILEYAKKPIVWILALNAAVYLTGLCWGLPSSEDWHSDSLAPYYPLLGLSQGFSFGYLNKYPLVHQMLLALLNIPVAVAAFINSNPTEGLSLSKFLMLIRSPEYASVLTFTDRFVSVLMGLGIVYWMYRCAKELFGECVGWLTALLLTFDAALAFYAHMAKVEVPYIFWGVLGMYMLIRVVKYERLRDYVYLALFSCLCYGTKDQGYAIFVLPFIMYLVVYKIIYRKAGTTRLAAAFRKNFLIFALAFIGFSIVTQNIILNWEGFVYRFGILTGWNGQRSISYTMELAGIWALLVDNIRTAASNGIGMPLVLLYAGGAVAFIVATRNDKQTLRQQAIFLWATLSVYLCFIQVVRQAQVRYLIPATVFMSVYGAWFINFIWERAKGKVRICIASALAVLCIYSFYPVVSTDMNLLNDLRVDAEKWMKDNVPAGSRIEYYAYLHYLPRFSEDVYAYRVTKRAMEIEKRKPDYIVLTSHYYTRFFGGTEANVAVDGRIVNTPKAIDIRTSSDMPEFLQNLFDDKLNYVVAKDFIQGKRWYKRITHARISPERILIYKRVNK